ncbi:hypothetical protein Taro_014275 [Colocasia esculenta]|uniref:CCHC-type domain-containing protein n=1 Tax=Colocasia esculenta TaxID=4460 RepID=A0A843UIF0_COLES|nr:hypothetical protein [Colocasia esculenta]
MPSSSPDCNNVQPIVLVLGKCPTVAMLSISRWDGIFVPYMASRGRRGGVHARDGEQRRDEPRREEQTEQQAPAPQGHVLPPPPPVDYGVFMQGLVQAMQTQAHTQAALQAQLEAQAQAPDPQAQDRGGPSIMERPAAPFQRQDRKKAAYQPQQRPAASTRQQVVSQHSPSGKKECPHCGRTHGGTECWMVAGKCLKCGSSDHKIKDCLRLQQGVQRGPAPVVAAAAPATG